MEDADAVKGHTSKRCMRAVALALFALGCSVTINVAAAAYPDRPIRLIVPSAAGGGPDTVARLISAEFTKQMGQQIVVDNRPGGAFIIGMDAIAKAAPDGYTPTFKEKYGAIGNEPLGGTPEQFAAFIRKESAKWAEVVKHVGAKLD